MLFLELFDKKLQGPSFVTGSVYTLGTTNGFCTSFVFVEVAQLFIDYIMHHKPLLFLIQHYVII